MGLLTFSINVTLDGCVDHRAGIADDEEEPAIARLWLTVAPSSSETQETQVRLAGATQV